MRVGVGGIGVAVGGSIVGGGGVVGSTVGEGMNCVGSGARLVGVEKAVFSGMMIVLEQWVPKSSVNAIMILSFFSAKSSR